MRFLLDECVDTRLLSYLKHQGHDVAAITPHHSAGLPDRQVLELARDEQRVLVTNDRHFGSLVFVEHQPHTGVILLRLGPHADLAQKIERLDYVLAHHAAELDRFLVVTRDSIRIR